MFVLFIVTASCKKQYNPPIINSPGSYLVVEGVINSGSDSTLIKLSRTVKLSSKASVNPELNAIVRVESDQGVSYPLTEAGNGNYSCAGLNLDNSRKYRLSIKTANNNQYQSDYVAVLNSPPIDSISYDLKGNASGPGINIYATTHDPNNKVSYYRWDYQETWAFHSAFESLYKSNGDTVLVRDLTNDEIYTCWKSDTSSTIVLGSSAKLAKDVIFNSPITTIASTDEKIGVEYSILLKQYALSPDAYSFYVNLKKNTEQLGSIFDAQPSQNPGNIHSVTNPSEPVIGYICIGSPSSQRIFIKNGQLPIPWKINSPYSGCVYFTDDKYRLPCCYYLIYGGYAGLTPFNQVDEFINYDNAGFTYYDKNGSNGDAVIPISAIGHPGQPPIGYTGGTKDCADCTLRGTNKKPAFWQ
jgi:hypothetical protein